MRKSYRRTKSRNKARTSRPGKRWNARRTPKSAWSKKSTRSTPKFVTSPFAKTFINGCKKGQPCTDIINAICKRTGKSFNTVCASLLKSGVCCGQKINGQWICWPNFKTRTNTAACKKAQRALWQGFVDWCITGGVAGFRSFNTKVGPQATFTKSFQSLIARQCALAGTSKVKTPKNIKRGSTKAWPNWKGNYAFPTLHTSARRWSKAA